ncbi:MAG: OmpH family outer membrane protein [Planctomycetales bacterium]
MKKRLLFVATSMMAFCLVVSLVNGQGGRRPGPSGVAIVDLSRVFKSHPGFKADTEAMKREVQASDTYFKGQQEKVKGMAKNLKRFNPGTIDYKREEAALAQYGAKIEAEFKLKRKDLVMQEAAVYDKTYKEISEEVRRYASNYNLALVLRYTGKPPTTPGVPQHPKQVMAQLNKAVVYHNPAVDITETIIRSLAAKYPAAPRGPIGRTPLNTNGPLPSNNRFQR